MTEPARVSRGPRRGRWARPIALAASSGQQARAAARHATGTSRATGRSAIAASPAPSSARLAATPGLGSARRAGPIGISGEAATATATARQAAGTVTAVTRARDSAARLRRVMPSARRVGKPAESRTSWRPSSWARIASPIRPVSAAKTASETTCGRVACSVAVTWRARLTTEIPPADGSRRASATAARRNDARLTPGRRRTPA